MCFPATHRFDGEPAAGIRGSRSVVAVGGQTGGTRLPSLLLDATLIERYWCPPLRHATDRVARAAGLPPGMQDVAVPLELRSAPNASRTSSNCLTRLP
jgi:hypothetical protein